MNILKLTYVLFKLNILSPKGLSRLIMALFQCGINAMTLLQFAGTSYSKKIALVDDEETLTYAQLRMQSENLATIFSERYELRSGKRVAFLCRNHASFVKAIFSVSRTGADVCFLNTELGQNQMIQVLDELDIDLLVCDVDFISVVEKSNYHQKIVVSYHDELPAINRFVLEKQEGQKLQRASSSKMLLRTGGTTGKAKEVAHRPSIFTYLNPFIGLLTRLKLLRYETTYVATPIYHGYGLAVLFLFIALGKKIVVSKGFEAERACTLIREHKIEVVTVVPLMLQKMLKHNVDDLKTLHCIASGSAVLTPKLVDEVLLKLGNIIYNLYGTSETGLNIIATPQDLQDSATTLGRKIKGVPFTILDSGKRKVDVGTIGQFCMKEKNNWIETGDMGYQDENGYYYLSGRIDDMIVSAGVNVYPVEVEQILIQHPYVAEVAVIGVVDAQFGNRLQAYVQPMKDASLSTQELYEWLRRRAARFQMPKDIVLIDQMPYTPLGKVDKQRLRSAEVGHGG
ncbi:AMP-binding protein [Bacillus salitolerans]|uniref:AMP-binding protein n=1 Tax=Bacillus salitolerans TaxID=1437434 RepID=A0ABW4LRW4_9BACI